jgi:hypothetical protein
MPGYRLSSPAGLIADTGVITSACRQLWLEFGAYLMNNFTFQGGPGLFTNLTTAGVLWTAASAQYWGKGQMGQIWRQCHK